MKTTNIETLVCNARMRNWVFVKVLTDEPGLYGWGEATLEWHTRSVVGAVQDLAQLLIGEDPTRVEHLWQIMFRQHFWHGNGIVRGTAISGIDIALWDIVGKVFGAPCHRLWGGPVRDSIRTYAHLGGGKMESFYAVNPEDAPRFADLAIQAKERGFTAFKAMAEAYRIALAPHHPQGPVSTAASLEFGFATPSYLICETVDHDVPWRGDVVSECYEVDRANRTVQPHNKPGLGIEINEDEVSKHPFEQEIPMRHFHRDGSVGDW